MAKTRQQIIAGALYAFASKLTCTPGTIQVGANHHAGPLAEAVDAFCREAFGKDYGEPDVANWRETMKLLPPVVNDKIDPEYAERLYGGAPGGGKSRFGIVKHTAYGVPPPVGSDSLSQRIRSDRTTFAPINKPDPATLSAEEFAKLPAEERLAAYRAGKMPGALTIPVPTDRGIEEVSLKVFKDMLSKYIDTLLCDYNPNTADILRIAGIRAPRFVAQEIVNERPDISMRIEGFDILRKEHYVVERGIAPRLIDENGGMTNIRCDHCIGCVNPSKCATNIGVARCDGDHGMPVCDDPGCWQK